MPGTWRCARRACPASPGGDILPGWFETYLGLEAAAAAIRTFEVRFVHGLFQTEDYARAVTLRGAGATPAT
jgi:hypothetical protein